MYLELDDVVSFWLVWWFSDVRDSFYQGFSLANILGIIHGPSQLKNKLNFPKILNKFPNVLQ